MEAQLLGFVKTAPGIKDTSSTAYQVLVALTYVALFFSVSATVSSLILTDECTDLDVRAASKPKRNELEEMEAGMSIDELLVEYGMRKSCWGIKIHWAYMLLSGYVCFLTQMVLYVSLADTTAVRVVTYIAGAVSILPIASLLEQPDKK
ncbi:transmembrane protein [Ceratobasidium sp. AG-Ba]|nr:transmembrane protein [Ceratobasidium sp. AG-Ba]QRW14263.1 transmembrane protein [Ceratobasidium sp. AG-Ba]